MTEYQPIFRSPIAPVTTGGLTGGVQVQDVTGLPVILCQGRAADALQATFGAVPDKPGAVVAVSGGALACLTPTVYYGFGFSAGATWPTADTLNESLPPPVRAIDMTHGLAALRLQGPAAAELLPKICGLDFSERAFPNQWAAQTSAAKIKTLIIRLDEKTIPTYYLAVDRSLGQYFWDVLVDAGQEFGISS